MSTRPQLLLAALDRPDGSGEPVEHKHLGQYRTVLELVQAARHDQVPSFGDCGTVPIWWPGPSGDSDEPHGPYGSVNYSNRWDIPWEVRQGVNWYYVEPEPKRWYNYQTQRCGCGCGDGRNVCFFCHKHVPHTREASKGGAKMRDACPTCADLRDAMAREEAARYH